MASILERFKNFMFPIQEQSSSSPNISQEQMLSQDWIRNLVTGNVRGFKSKFITDIYSERTLYPHEEMAIAAKAFKYNAYIASASRTRGNFLITQLTASSDDEATADWLNEIIKSTGLGYYASQYMGQDCVVTGNFYLERIRDRGKIVAYEYVPNSERIYIIVDDKGFVKYYFQEVPERYKNTQFKTLDYYGDKKKQVRGIELPKEKICHIKLGCAELPQYGRGYVATVSNDVEVLLEVERAIAVISRYKAIPKKIISIMRGDDPNGGKAAEFYANQIGNMSDTENPVLPEEVKINDLSYSGQELNFEPIVNYLKKKITVNLAPSFIMHGEETNYAVSRDQKEAFIQAVETERKTVEYQLKRELQFLAKTHGKKLADFKLEFGDFDLGQEEEKKNYARDLFMSNVITLNEAREILGYPEDEEMGESYSSELQATGGLLGFGREPEAEAEQEGAQVRTDKQDSEEA